MSEKENNETEEEIIEKPKKKRSRKKKTDDSKFKELSSTDLKTEIEDADPEPVVYEQNPVKKKAPKRGGKKTPPKPKQRQKSVMELATCPSGVNPKHWKIVQARARRKNEINQFRGED